MKFLWLIFLSAKIQKTIRKEIRSLSKAEWKKYKDAFNLFKDKGYLADISKIHLEVDAYAHRNGRFLPWHRMLLLHVESILQMLTKDPTLGIPYWDWTLDADDPGKSIIFDEEHWGISECYLVNYPTPHCLERITKDIEPFYNKKNMERLMSLKVNYDKYRDVLELVPHALVHMNLGGDMGQMFSTNDPIFWHHHSFIDYIWYQKQVKHLKNSYGGFHNNKELSIEERLYPFNRQVKDVMGLKKCQVVYRPYKALKIQSIEKKPTPLREDYIKFHGYNKENVRKYESYLRGETKRGILRRIFDFLTGRKPLGGD